MPLHPWIAEKIELLRDVPSFEAAMTDPQYAERWAGFNEDPEPWTPPAGVTVSDATADGPHGPVPLRVFRVSTGSTTGGGSTTPSALLWMHGGGFVSGSVHDTESVIPATELAARAGAVVVSVDYRLAIGGLRYPVPLDDVEAAWHWMTHNVAAERYLIGGASVGANLAISCAVRMRDGGGRLPDGMLLAYPLAHFPTPAPSPERAAELAQLPAMLRFPTDYQLGIAHNYLGRLDDIPADAAPGNHDVAGLPEAWIAPAEFDDLRPSGELLAEQLRAAGVPAHVDLAAGMVHGHLGRSPSLEPVSATLDFFASALR